LVRRRDTAGPLGSLETEVMGVLWEADTPLSVRETVERLNMDRAAPLAYTTVMTVLSRLAEKGILARQRSGRGYAYQAVARDTAEIAVRDVLGQFGDAALARFVDQVELNPQLRRRLLRVMRNPP
jgi:predicted transcriptional regulator